MGKPGLSEVDMWVPGANMGDTGDKVWAGGTTKEDGGGMEMGPGCAGCVCARCRDGEGICSRPAGVSLWEEDTDICNEWLGLGCVDKAGTVNVKGPLTVCCCGGG